MGAALGTIMAIIINHHMLTMMPAYSRFHRAGVAIADMASHIGVGLARPSADSSEDISQAGIPMPAPATT
jgi:hypothetical protein